MAFDDSHPRNDVILFANDGTELDLATQTKLEAVRVLMAALEGKDFATQATLDAFLTAFGSEDFASQTTLAALLAAFDAEDFSSETTLAALLVAFNAEDFASETTLLAADGRLTTIDAVLDSIKDVDGIKKITDPIGIGPGSELIGTVKVRGSDGLHDANVDSSHRLSVTGALVIPAGFVDVSVAVQSTITGNNAIDTDHVVPDTKVLTLSQFYGGGEVQTAKASKFELYHSTDGGATDGTLLGVGYIGAGSNNFRLDLNYDVTGDGTDQVVRMRRERMDGVSLELASGWIGIETI
jgi:hypothetical protein